MYGQVYSQDCDRGFSQGQGQSYIATSMVKSIVKI